LTSVDLLFIPGAAPEHRPATIDARPSSMTRYGRSPWLDSFPKSRVPGFPRQRGPLQSDVVIIGGGLTGCATAYAFAAAGIKVILVEAQQIGRGSAGSSAGWISDDPGVSFQEVEHALGLRAARHGWQSWRRAALDFIALVRRLDLKCDLEQRGALLVAATPEQQIRLRKEQKVRRDAGLDAPMATAKAVATEAAVTALAAIRTRDGATVHPYRATLGLAYAAIDRGARFFEHSPARKITFSRKWVDVRTADGTIRADRVVVATGVPTETLFKTLARHFWYRSSYLALTERVPAKIRQQLGRRGAIVRDSAVPPHVIRWVDDEKLLVSGADSETVPPRQKEKVIVQRTGQLMYEMSTIYPEISGIQPEYGWEAMYGRTADGLPYIGPHRNYPRHLFAFGDASHSVTGAYLASRILLRHFLDQSEAADEVFGFLRLPRSG
jgi:glycine/D-amino acid oxidase-like deaminating enzyme